MPSFVDAGVDLDHAGRAEVGPGELLLARPDDLDRLAGRLRQPGRLDRRLAGVLAAVAGAHVRHDHAHLVRRHAERAGELAADAERPLRAGPDGQLAVLPLGDGGPRLERDVGDVGDRVRRLHRLVGGLRARPRSSPARAAAAAAAALAAARRRFSFRCLNRSFAGDLRRRLPLGLDGVERLVAAGARSGATTPTKSPSRTTVTPGIASAAFVSTDVELRLERRRAQHLAEQHPRPADVGRVLVRAGDERRGRRPSAPTCRRPSTSSAGGRRHVGRDHLHQLLALRQLAEGERRLAVRAR